MPPFVEDLSGQRGSPHDAGWILTMGLSFERAQCAGEDRSVSPITVLNAPVRPTFRPVFQVFPDLVLLLRSGIFAEPSGRLVRAPHARPEDAMTHETEAIDFDQATAMWRLLHGSKLPAGLTAELRFLDYRADGKTRPAHRCNVSDEHELTEALRRHGAGRLCVLGLQPRTAGHPEMGKAPSVPEVRNVLLDIEPKHERGAPATDAQREATRTVIEEHIKPWLAGAGFGPPVVEDSGNGFHLLMAIDPIKVAEVPDVEERVKALTDRLRHELAEALDAAGARIDAMHDLARVVKVAGTAKPLPDHRRSAFVTAPERREDAALREHLLTAVTTPPRGPSEKRAEPKSYGLTIADLSSDNIPEHFFEMLDAHPRLKGAWEGTLTDIKDTSGSGQDASLVTQLAHLGITDPRAVGAILFNAPGRKTAKRPDAVRYIERTIHAMRSGLKPGVLPGTGLEDVVADARWLSPAQDFRDGLAFFARAVVTDVEVKTKKGEAYRERCQDVRIIVSDRRALALRQPKRVPGRQALVQVRGTPYVIARSGVTGTDRWRLFGGRFNVRAFIGGKAPDVDVRQLYPYLRSRIEQHALLPDRADSDLVATYIVLSYLYRMFAAVPYLHLNGPKGSGKTTLGRVFTALGFNGLMVTSCSEASLFRTLDRTGGMFVLDEIEGMSTREASGEDAKTSILRAGYQKGATVTRQDTKDVHVTHSFDVFGPKVILNIRGLDDILSDRAIRIHTRPATRWEAHELGRYVPPAHDKAWANLRDALYCLAMQNHSAIARLCEAMQDEDFGLINRDRELWFPLFVVGRCLDERGAYGLEQRLRALATSKAAEREAVRAEGPEEALQEALLALLKERAASSAEVTLDEILAVLAGWADVFDPLPTAKALGRLLSTIGVAAVGRKTDASGHRVRVYEVSEDKLRRAK